MRAISFTTCCLIVILAGAYAWRGFWSSGEMMQIGLPLIVDGTEGIDAGEGVIVGCGDRLVTVQKIIPDTVDPMTAVYEHLFTMDAVITHEGRAYVNPIAYHSMRPALEEGEFAPLSFDRVIVQGGKATVYLTGDYVTIGTCEPPQTEAVLVAAAMQFPSINQVDILLNGEGMTFTHE